MKELEAKDLREEERGWMRENVKTGEVMRNKQGCLVLEVVRESGKRRELGMGLHLAQPTWNVM